jgi:hypothetical protein
MEDYIILDEDYFWKTSVGVGNIQWIMLHIVRYNDMALLKLLLNNGLKINSPPIKKYFTYTGLMRDNIINILLLYKVDLKYHYDIKSDISTVGSISVPTWVVIFILLIESLYVLYN